MVELLESLKSLGITGANVIIVVFFLRYLAHRDKGMTRILIQIRKSLQDIHRKVDSADVADEQ